MKNFYECKTNEEKQQVRDEMLEQMYYQMIATRREVSQIKDCVARMEQKLVYVGATPDERRFLNVDGSLNLDAVNDSCDRILELFGDKYAEEDNHVNDDNEGL